MSLLPPWRRSDLPHPPAFTLGNAVRVIGPGTLLLGVSLGAGDWLLGPAVTVTYGPALLWLCTMSVVLQAVLNTEMARYTLATGEPIFTGFMRTPPGAPFWGWSYSLLHLIQVAWPAGRSPPARPSPRSASGACRARKITRWSWRSATWSSWARSESSCSASASSAGSSAQS